MLWEQKNNSFILLEQIYEEDGIRAVFNIWAKLRG